MTDVVFEAYGEQGDVESVMRDEHLSGLRHFPARLDPHEGDRKDGVRLWWIKAGGVTSHLGSARRARFVDAVAERYS